jgi:hypothetical protein
MRLLRRTSAALLSVAIGLAAFALPAYAAPGEDLWAAMVEVESGGNARAYNPHDGATGIIQIRTVCVTDSNRIVRKQGAGRGFTLSDRLRPAASRQIWHTYLEYYGRQYQRETGREPTHEVYARIWNGGPDGWRQTSTLSYWKRVQAAIPAAQD